MRIHVNWDIVYQLYYEDFFKQFQAFIGVSPGPFLCSNYSPISWCSDTRISTYIMRWVYLITKEMYLGFCLLLLQNDCLLFHYYYLYAICLNIKYNLIFQTNLNWHNPGPVGVYFGYHDIRGFCLLSNMFLEVYRLIFYLLYVFIVLLC